MKILVIFTGGTIGSSIKGGWADVDRSTQYVLLRKFNDVTDVEFVTVSPFSVLSENLSATELNLLQKELEANITKDFGGIIVTHGTDTLQYTAAAVEYAFSGCKMPIVFVSADYPLEDPKTNGYANFEAAVEFIKAQKAAGVFVSYKNDDLNETHIHLASCILQHGEYDANLYSLGGTPFATYGQEMVFHPVNTAPAKSIGAVEYVKNPGILSVESYPGNDYSYCLDNVKAIILKPYHSGTLDTANRALKDFCLRAQAQSIPVFVSNTAADVSYKSTKRYGEMGLCSLPYGTYIAAYMKIWAAISLGRDITDFLNTRIANEQTDES